MPPSTPTPQPESGEYTEFSDSEEYGTLLLAFGFDTAEDQRGSWKPIKPDYIVEGRNYPLYSDDRYESYTDVRSGGYTAKVIHDHVAVLTSGRAGNVPFLQRSPNYPTDSSKSDWSKKGTYTITFAFKGESAYINLVCTGNTKNIASPIVMGDPETWKTVSASFTVDGKDIQSLYAE